MIFSDEIADEVQSDPHSITDPSNATIQATFFYDHQLHRDLDAILQKCRRRMGLPIERQGNVWPTIFARGIDSLLGLSGCLLIALGNVVIGLGVFLAAILFVILAKYRLRSKDGFKSEVFYATYSEESSESRYGNVWIRTLWTSYSGFVRFDEGLVLLDRNSQPFRAMLRRVYPRDVWSALQDLVRRAVSEWRDDSNAKIEEGEQVEKNGHRQAGA